MNSSADSSYSESNNSDSNNPKNIYQHHNQHHHHHHQQNRLPPQQHLENQHNEDEHDISIFPANQMPPSMGINATPAHQQMKQINQNYLLQNHFSTPSNNQNPPPPQTLQATIIPTVQEDKHFFRPRNKQLEPIASQTENTIAQGIDETDNMDEVTQHNQDINQYLSLQKQHYVPHAKTHSMERFAIPQNILEKNEENTFRNSAEGIKIPIASFGNGVQLEFSTDNNPNLNHEIIKQKQNQQDMFVIDLSELDEAQKMQLADEEKMQKIDLQNIDLNHLFKLYVETQFMFKARGKKLEELAHRFTAYQEDMSREIRAMKHKVCLAEKEKETVQSSLSQAHELCNQYKSESDSARKACADMQEKMEKIAQQNRKLEQKIQDQELEIDNLHMQLNEQQKVESLEKLQQQHEHFVQTLREQNDKEMFQIKEIIAQNQKELSDRQDYIRALTMQLQATEKNLEQATLEKAEMAMRMNKTITEMQANFTMNNNTNKLNEDGKTKLIEQLTDKCRELEQELKMVMFKTNQTSNDSLDFHISNMSNTLNVLNANESSSTGSMKSLQNELERALNLLKKKKEEIQMYQNEIDRLKSELTNGNGKINNEVTLNEINNLKAEIERLNHLLNDLQSELDDKNIKMDQLMQAEEELHNIKTALETELYKKQHEIEECNQVRLIQYLIKK